MLLPDLQIIYTLTNKTRTYRGVCNVKNTRACADVKWKIYYPALCTKFLWKKWWFKTHRRRGKKQEIFVSHMDVCMDFSVLGKLDIREQLHSACLRQLRCEKNYFTCIKFYRPLNYSYGAMVRHWRRKIQIFIKS